MRVQPRASRNEITVEDDGHVKIRVTSAPTDGKANEAVVALIADALGVAKSRVTILTGLTSREKQLAVEGLDEQQVLERLRTKG